MAENDKNNAPVKKYKRMALEVARWENETREGKTYHTFSFQRSYKDGEEWKQTQSLRQSDLLVLASLLQQAFQDTEFDPSKTE